MQFVPASTSQAVKPFNAAHAPQADGGHRDRGGEKGTDGSRFMRTPCFRDVYANMRAGKRSHPCW